MLNYLNKKKVYEFLGIFRNQNCLYIYTAYKKIIGAIEKLYGIITNKKKIKEKKVKTNGTKQINKIKTTT